MENWDYPERRTGIEKLETQRSPDWANAKWTHFCRVNLGKAGEPLIGTTDICWGVTDHEIRVIAGLSTLNRFRFRADLATDTALAAIAELHDTTTRNGSDRIAGSSGLQIQRFLGASLCAGTYGRSIGMAEDAGGNRDV